MDPRRASAGEWIGAGAGLLLVVSLFVTWYDPGVSGWEAFSVADVVFALTGILAVLAWVATIADRGYPPPVSVVSITMLFALVAVVLIVFRLFDLPGDVAGRALGFWLGVAGVAGVAAATTAAMRDEGPARRSPEAERRAAAEALERAELLELPAEPPVGTGSR